MKLLPREQDAIDGLKFCVAHGRRPFMFDIKIALRLIDKLMRRRSRRRKTER